MTDALADKAIACLEMAALPADSPARQQLYARACARWSEKAVIAKFESLVDRGYMDCGVSARTGWLTEKGKAALHERKGAGK